MMGHKYVFMDKNMAYLSLNCLCYPFLSGALPPSLGYKKGKVCFFPKFNVNLAGSIKYRKNSKYWDMYV